MLTRYMEPSGKGPEEATGWPVRVAVFPVRTGQECPVPLLLSPLLEEARAWVIGPAGEWAVTLPAPPCS